EDEARAETVKATRRFARRQEAWFRRDPRVSWLDATAGDLLERAVACCGPAGRAGAGATHAPGRPAGQDRPGT
ncbi:MAG: tRNA (adenosine(37)-N6)-dimethylallyltransferase MiaA, partial [Nocardiopsaceae bacterium]|nr:tRNA (adenosine(37)-N6)-dimethylallyltransferase MiaA [Nocardiopsaceae bacterium]